MEGGKESVGEGRRRLLVLQVVPECGRQGEGGDGVQTVSTQSQTRCSPAQLCQGEGLRWGQKEGKG